MKLLSLAFLLPLSLALASPPSSIDEGYPRLSGFPQSPLWAQRISGLLEANRYLRNASTPASADFARVLVFDSFRARTEEGTHGNRVVSNLLGEGLEAASPFATLVERVDSDRIADTLVEEIKKSGANVISTSTGDFEDRFLPSMEKSIGCQEFEGTCTRRKVQAFFRKLFGDRILVVAAGNSYPSNFPEAPADWNPILVGAMSEWGVPAGYTVRAPEVDIYAPAGDSLLSRDDGQFALFGGTSGSQPLVAGTIATAKALEKSLTTDEIRKLLRLTATLYMTQTRTYPVLNAYRFVRTVLRLREYGWSKLSPSAKSRLLKRADLVDFSKEAREELALGLENARSSNEAESLEGVNQLTRAFLLGETRSAGAALMAWFSARNLEFDALAWQNLSQPSSEGRMSADQAIRLIERYLAQEKNTLAFTAFIYVLDERPEQASALSRVVPLGSSLKKYLFSWLNAASRRPLAEELARFEPVLTDPAASRRLGAQLTEIDSKYFFFSRAGYARLLERVRAGEFNSLAPKVLSSFSAAVYHPDPRRGGREGKKLYLLPEEQAMVKALAASPVRELAELAKPLSKQGFSTVDYWDPNPFLSEDQLYSGDE